ncbi:hypothetical protein HPB49_024167 [Dermacentor silvarum]|uniref:Uncharacterized protein n=1 Tax=Dermacentor silvarum TaxID=543639 RepID=A0ACB8D8Z8_DERSI|nr:hypothetical protein HPB49_024167 [Dermacentor silvarum]
MQRRRLPSPLKNPSPSRSADWRRAYGHSRLSLPRREPARNPTSLVFRNDSLKRVSCDNDKGGKATNRSTGAPPRDKNPVDTKGALRLGQRQLRLRDSRRTAERRAIRTADQEDWTIYRGLDRVCRRHANQRLRQSWEGVCSSIASATSSSMAWRLLGSLQQGQNLRQRRLLGADRDGFGKPPIQSLRFPTTCPAPQYRGGVRDKHATDALGYMITHDDLPLTTTEKDRFKTFVKALQPLYKPPTEPTVTKTLEEKYEELRAHYGRRIRAADHLSLTADLWTHESTMRSYLGHKVHFSKGKLLSEVNTRFTGMEYLRSYAAATILEPRYKKYVFEHPQLVAMIAVAHNPSRVFKVVLSYLADPMLAERL